MKSIHFSQVPSMRGKLSIRWTDVLAENYKPREAAKQARKEMRDAMLRHPHPSMDERQ